MKACPDCKGSGRDPMTAARTPTGPCPMCNGRGSIPTPGMMRGAETMRLAEAYFHASLQRAETTAERLRLDPSPEATRQVVMNDHVVVAMSAMLDFIAWMLYRPAVIFEEYCGDFLKVYHAEIVEDAGGVATWRSPQDVARAIDHLREASIGALNAGDHEAAMTSSAASDILMWVTGRPSGWDEPLKACEQVDKDLARDQPALASERPQ